MRSVGSVGFRGEVKGGRESRGERSQGGGEIKRY